MKGDEIDLAVAEAIASIENDLQGISNKGKTMSIFKNIAERLSVKKQSLFEQYLELLARADNPLDGDSETLERIIGELGLTVEQAQQDAEVIAEVKSLQPLADDFGNRCNAMHEAKAKADAWGKQTEAILTQRNAEHERLLVAHGRASGQVSNANIAVERMKTLVKQNPKLFPLNPLASYNEAIK